MESTQVRLLSKELGVKYLRSQIERIQRLLERCRRCDCPELGGKGCNCVKEDDKEVFNRCEGFLHDNSSQTEVIHASPANSRGLIYQRSDSSVPRDFADASQILGTSPSNVRLSKGALPKDQEYEGVRNPYVLVINNVNFNRDPRPRNGAKHDQENVERFVREAGFSCVLRHFDLPRREMLILLEEIRKSEALFENDGFICIIMSHGNEEGILCSDHKAIPVEEIMEKFRGGMDACPQLAKKPKLFFIQACRGEVEDKGYFVPRGPKDVYSDTADIEMPVKLPSDADFLIAYSTTKGTLSHRRFTVDRKYAEAHKASLGSWFISCLVQVLCENSHKEDLMTMLTRVNRAMCECYSEAGSKQISCQLSMLTRKVYFSNFLNKKSRSRSNTD